MRLFNNILLVRRYQIIISIIFIIIVTFVSFSSSLDNNFTNWDDQKFITDNPLIKNLSWDNLEVIFTTFYKENFRQPLVLLSFSLEYHFFKLNPFIYHLDNLILHVLNALLVFYLIFILSDNVFISLITAVLFGVHPLHVESVAWISERKDVLSTFFFLLAVIFYLFYKKKNRLRYYHLSLFVFILSFLSKAMAVSLPFILILCDYVAYRGFNKRTLLEKVPFFFVSCLFGLVNFFLHHSTGAIISTRFSSPFENILIACRGVIFYLTKTLLPVNLSAHYPYPKVVSILSPEFLLSSLLLLTLVIAVYLSKRWTRKIIFGSLFFIITLLPVLELVPLGSTFVADRYMYIPSIGLFYMAGLFFYNIFTWEAPFERLRKASIVIFLGIVLFALSVLTYERNNTWHDSETLWKSVIDNYPENIIAHSNLGAHYEKKGLVDLAVKRYRQALAVDPKFTKAYYNLGNIYSRKGLLDEAIIEYKKALAIDPKYVGVLNGLGVAYGRKGLVDLAIREYEKIIKIDPTYAEAYYNLTVAYYTKGDRTLALKYYNRTKELGYPMPSWFVLKAP